MPIDDVIPHRGAARLIDRLLLADEDRSVVEADVPAGSRWVRDGAMPSWVGIELMAQAVAAWAGARAQRQGRAAPVGFLLGTRRYESFEAGFAVGSTLRISTQREFTSDQGLGLFDCVVEQGGRTLAQARLSVFEPADPAAYLGGADTGGEP